MSDITPEFAAKFLGAVWMAGLVCAALLDWKEWRSRR
jgi:hypothetical protein